MVCRDFRDWLDLLDKRGELLRLKDEISLEPDVGAIGRAICDLEGPGVIAEKIVGTKIPMALCLHASWRRAALAIGLPKDMGPRQQVQAWLAVYDRYPVKARVVNNAPCKENILTGEKVNLFDFPIPRLNLDDASFYITKSMVITRAPDSDWVNVGMYRMMVLGRNRTTIFINPAQDIGSHYRKCWEAGKPMEMAVALGTEPVLPMVAGMKIPVRWNEYDFAGAVRKEPEELIRAETVDLPVPARAEIVLEGTVAPDVLALEGPFGEHTGAYSGFFMHPVFEIKAITHRNNPIYDCLFQGKPINEENYMCLASRLAGVQQSMQNMFPQITQVGSLLPAIHNVVIQGRWLHRGEPKAVINAWFGSGLRIGTKVVTVVDEDVDPWNPSEVMWAIATRCQANTDLVIIPGMETALDPSKEMDNTTCKLGIDATKSRPPFYRHRPVAWVTTRAESEDWKKKIREQWPKGGK